MITPRKGLFAVVLVLLLFSLLDTGLTGYVTRPISGTVKTVQYPAGWIASNIKTDMPVTYPDRPEQELNDLLAKAHTANDQLWQENERLRDQLEAYKAISIIRPIEQIKPVESRVAQHRKDRVNPTINILRGSLHGLEYNQAVVYKSNLIGFVTQDIGPVNATVALINRPGFEVQINIMPPEGTAVGQGWPVRSQAKWSDEDDAFIISELDKHIASELRIGDIVRISDTVRDNANGFLLGEIAEIKEHKIRPLQVNVVVIRPRVPIGAQRLVTVLTDPDE